MEKMDIKVAIVTVSDRCSAGTMKDMSGPALKSLFENAGYTVSSVSVIPDDFDSIEEKLISLSDLGIDLVITTGGTGFAPRDVTPEATLEVCEKQVPGIPEAIRAESLKITPMAMLSRAAAGIRGRTLIINFPGSPKACSEAFSVIEGQLVHAIGLLRGEKMDR